MDTRNIAIAGVLACVGSAMGASVESRFDADAQGWTFVQLDFATAQNPPAVATTAPLSWFAAGGNPGGYVEITTDPSPLWSWFSAPAAYLGDQSGYSGGTISWDGISTADGAASEVLPAVILVGASQTLYYDSSWATAAWTHFSIPLTAGGWYTDMFDPAGSAATTGDLVSALGSLQALYIEGDWSTIPEMERLDNVVLTPAPGTVVLALMGLGGMRRRRV